ncbi:MAG: ABC transporter ATP-binding protein [Flavobacteriales bacterium]|nr:MAG: ABC transporter ATP-binding protein [Flavobacteriales bacterium]
MLQLEHVSFTYGTVPVLEDINLKVSKGEHLSIIGESGCGKSTLLKIIYGLLQLQKGKVYWNDLEVLGPNFNLVPGESYMKYLSQDFDLMPFTTAEENVGQFLSVFEPDEMKRRTAELLTMLEMTDFAKIKVKYLSGGQQQRIALARVLAQEPEVLLLDEPFGHIDNFRKNSLRRNLFTYLKEKYITVLTATHDHNDVLPYADRDVVIKDTHIIADNTPKNLYERPKSMYIASLFGEANLIPLHIIKSYADTKRHIIVYSQEFKVSEKSGLEVVVEKSFYTGGSYMMVGKYDGQRLYFNHNLPLEKGKKVFLNISIETINQRLADT